MERNYQKELLYDQMGVTWVDFVIIMRIISYMIMI